MTNTQINQLDYTAYQPNMLLDFHFSYEKDIAADDISRTVSEAVEGACLIKYVSFKNRNAHGYDRIMMLKLVLLAMTLFGYTSTRQLAELCRNDIRFIFIAQGARPSHESFHRFIHDDLKMSIEDIFIDLNKYIEKHDEIDTDILYIDGTKYEANANKMTFVWKKATLKFRMKCWQKCMEEIKSLNRTLESLDIPLRFSLIKEISIDYLIEIADRLEETMEMKQIGFVHGKGKRKHRLQRHYDALKDYAVKMWKYAMHLDICGERNSFSKTDPDATFMHMKYDYYNHTNVFKPGYNVQMGISGGYIRHIYISSDANDLNTYIPFMKGYYEAYGEYPSRTPADAGYGSFDNYSFCKENGIELYMKYSGQRKQEEKTTEKNRFKTYKFERNEKNEIICPAGHIFEAESERIETRGIYPRKIEKLVNRHCEGCPLRSRCTKSKNGRTINRSKELEEFQKEARENMETAEGKRLMDQRSILSEGAFGNLKENWGYTKLRRRGESGVKTEMHLMAIGANLRKYHRRKVEKMKQADEMIAKYLH